MTRDKFIEILTFLCKEIDTAYELFDGYVAVYNKQATDNAEMNRTPGIFHMILFSFINLFVITLARLYDNNPSAIGIRKILNCLEQNYKSIGVSQQSIKIMISKNNTLIKEEDKCIEKLKRLRDNALAHNDKAFISRDTWIEIGITIGEYQRLLELAFTIISDCCVLLDIPVPCKSLGIKEDIDTIISALRNYPV